MLRSEISGSVVSSTNTLRASRRRVPWHEAQGRLLMNFASSSRTALDSVFVAALHVMQHAFERMAAHGGVTAIVDVFEFDRPACLPTAFCTLALRVLNGASTSNS